MKFLVEYPVSSTADNGEWIRPQNMTRFARTLEAAGIDAISLTEHPAPSQKWLDGGGHETFDPFVGLAYFAASTERLRLMTTLNVVPYRNPFLLAKAMTTVDVVSGGRATFVLGTGYLRSEFAALGVDFTERNELFDEAIEVLLGVWSGPGFSFTGRHFSAQGQTISPGPVQRPHPPLWLGGNASVVRERVARWGQGWQPLQGSAVMARTSRTRSIETLAELAPLLTDLGDRLEANGRARDDVDILAGDVDHRVALDAPADQHLESLARLAALGVTWTGLHIDWSSYSAALDTISRYGAEVIAAH